MLQKCWKLLRVTGIIQKAPIIISRILWNGLVFILNQNIKTGNRKRKQKGENPYLGFLTWCSCSPTLCIAGPAQLHLPCRLPPFARRTKGACPAHATTRRPPRAYLVRTPTRCHIDLAGNTSCHFAASRTVSPRVSPYLCPGPFAPFGSHIW